MPGFGQATPTACYDQALFLGALLEDAALYEGTTTPIELARLGRGLAPLLSGQPPNAAGMSAGAIATSAAHAQSLANVVETATALVASCVLSMAGVLPAAAPLGDLAFIDALDEASDGDLSAARYGLQQTVWRLQPELARLGEPEYIVELLQHPQTIVPEHGWINQLSAYQTVITAQEYKARLVSASLTLGTQAGAGPVEARVVATYPVPNAVSALRDSPWNVTHASFVANQTHAWRLGGEGSRSQEVAVLDAATGNWSLSSATLPGAPRKWAPSVMIGGKAYVFGGSTNTDILEYDPSMETVGAKRAITGAPSGGFSGATAVTNGSVAYVFGGGFGSAPATSHFGRYDPATNSYNAVNPTGSWIMRHNASGAWGEGKAYFFGGVNSAGTLLDTIVRYDPATNQITTLPVKLPSPRAYTSAAWDGQYAYVFGGHDGQKHLNDVLRFDPANGTITLMTGQLRTGAAFVAAAWNGTHALLVGGHNATQNNKTTAYNSQLDRPRNQSIVVGGGVSISLDVSHGTTYELNLSGIDNFGNTYNDIRRHGVDVVVPNLTSPISLADPTIYASSAVNLSWTAWDNLSGLAKAQVEVKQANGTWTPEPGASFTPGDHGPVNVSFSRPFGGTGSNVTLRLNVMDRAGNKLAYPEVKIVFDDTPPILTGLFHNLTELKYVTSAYLNSTLEAWDNASGLASVNITHHHPSAPLPQKSVNYTDGRNHTVVSHSTPPALHESYWLHLRAVDRAGNVNESNVSFAEIQVAPNLTNVIPELKFSNVSIGLYAKGNVILPGYTGELVDRVNITIRDAQNISVWSASTSGTNTASTFWNASTATPGSYLAEFEATSGKAATKRWIQFNLTQSADDATYQNLQQARTYGHLAYPGAYQLYHFQHDTTCGSYFGVSVESTDGTDVDLYVTNSNASSTSTFAQVRDSTSTNETVEWSAALPGEYTAMIKHKASLNASYAVKRYTKSTCQHSPQSEVPPPEQHLHNLD